VDYHRVVTYLVLYAEFHQCPRVTARSSVVDSEACDPFLIFFMRYDRHPMAFLLQGFPQCDVWLYIATRTNRQAYKVFGRHGNKDTAGHIYGSGEERTDDGSVP
jgi:hypothetical protein